MATLQHANRELYRRAPDERFPSLSALAEHCEGQRNESRDIWRPPGSLRMQSQEAGLCLNAGSDGSFGLNDWSFSQLCRMTLTSKDTVNRVSVDTAQRILNETMPSGDKPLQLLASRESLRSVHGIAYSRLWNADLLATVREFDNFQPPQAAINEATGLYCGEQDLFCFLIDPTGWIEVGGEQFAPGYFVWNSEVGKRSLGIMTFWFQKICQNHIVWDVLDVTEFTRKHTGNVKESLNQVRRIIELQIEKRDERRDGFAKIVANAMQQSLGSTSEDVTKSLLKQDLAKGSVERAVKQLGLEGKPFTLWNLVDALTHQNVNLTFAGDRTEADQKVARLLKLAV